MTVDQMIEALEIWKRRGFGNSVIKGAQYPHVRHIELTLQQRADETAEYFRTMGLVSDRKAFANKHARNILKQDYNKNPLIFIE